MILDNKELTSEEKERAIMMFSPDYYQAMNNSQNQAQQQMQQYQSQLYILQQQQAQIQQLSNSAIVNNLNSFIQHHHYHPHNGNIDGVQTNTNNVRSRVGALNLDNGSNNIPNSHVINNNQSHVVINSPTQMQSGNQLLNQQLLTTTSIVPQPNMRTADIVLKSTSVAQQQREYDRFLTRASSTSRKSISRTSGTLVRESQVSGVVSGAPNGLMQHQRRTSSSGGPGVSTITSPTNTNTFNNGVINMTAGDMNTSRPPPTTNNNIPSTIDVYGNGAFQVKKVPLGSGLMFNTKEVGPTIKSKKTNSLFTTNQTKTSLTQPSSHHFKMPSSTQAPNISSSSTPRSNSMFPKV
ncbi:hypothetical protein AKO1_004634 [Acrasis kona]|uniref:Uncharacterized protein n=1 Tax=Acrasis kona TaxID=1008807 RepID=A0AAW2Z514_9EUKA